MAQAELTDCWGDLMELLMSVRFSGSHPGIQRLKARDQVRLMAGLAGTESWLLLLPEWQTRLGSLSGCYTLGDIIWISSLVQSKALAGRAGWQREVRWPKAQPPWFSVVTKNMYFSKTSTFFLIKEKSAYIEYRIHLQLCAWFKVCNKRLEVLMLFVLKYKPMGQVMTPGFSLSDPKSHRVGAPAWAVSADLSPLSGIFLTSSARWWGSTWKTCFATCLEGFGGLVWKM